MPSRVKSTIPSFTGKLYSAALAVVISATVTVLAELSESEVTVVAFASDVISTNFPSLKFAVIVVTLEVDGLASDDSDDAVFVQVSTLFTLVVEFDASEESEFLDESAGPGVFEELLSGSTTELLDWLPLDGAG